MVSRAHRLTAPDAGVSAFKNGPSMKNSDINDREDGRSETVQDYTTHEPTLPSKQLELSSEEAGRLSELESVIERGKQAFIEVGNALDEINTKRLYRECYVSFKEYCASKWGFSRQQGYRLIDAAKIAAEVSPIGDTLLPASESAFRPLSALKSKDDRVTALISAAGKARRRPTAKEVERSVAFVKASKPEVYGTVEQDLDGATDGALTQAGSSILPVIPGFEPLLPLGFEDEDQASYRQMWQLAKSVKDHTDMSAANLHVAVGITALTSALQKHTQREDDQACVSIAA